MFFTPEHISKIISGAKTQTRRIVKPGEILHGGPFTVDGTKFYETPRAVYTGAIPHERLKWMVGRDYAVSPGRGKPGVWWYPATRTWVHPSDDQRATGPGYAGSLPLRIRLLAIRQEALQDISEEDVLAEGCALQAWAGEDQKHGWPKTAGYAQLWDNINTRPGTRWADNPRVWRLTFEVEWSPSLGERTDQ